MHISTLSMFKDTSPTSPPPPPCCPVNHLGRIPSVACDVQMYRMYCTARIHRTPHVLYSDDIHWHNEIHVNVFLCIQVQIIMSLSLYVHNNYYYTLIYK